MKNSHTLFVVLLALSILNFALFLFSLFGIMLGGGTDVGLMTLFYGVGLIALLIISFSINLKKKEYKGAFIIPLIVSFPVLCSLFIGLSQISETIFGDTAIHTTILIAIAIFTTYLILRSYCGRVTVS